MLIGRCSCDIAVVLPAELTEEVYQQGGGTYQSGELSHIHHMYMLQLLLLEDAVVQKQKLHAGEN